MGNSLRVTTKLTYASIEDFINNAQPLTEEGYDYFGPVTELKKGRNQLASASNAGVANTGMAQDIAKQDQGIQSGYRKQGDLIANSQMNTNGGLSPLVSKQLANEQGMIGKSYSDASRAADRGLSMRGMGVAPSGMSASIRNTGINNAGMANTGAVGNAFGTQNQLNQGTLGYDVGQQHQYDPLAALHTANEGVQATTGAASALNKAGSTFGDIGSGLQQGMSMGASIMCPAEGSLYRMADDSKKPVEQLEIGDRIKGVDDEPQTIEDIQSGFIDTIFVTTENGHVAHNSLIHAFALPKGGFVVAAKSLGKVILTDEGPSKVIGVAPAGKAWVFNVITDGSHTYCADGVWGLGVGDGEKQVGSNVWARINRRMAEETVGV